MTVMALRSFLVEFDQPEGLPAAFAVTARDEADALDLIQQTYRPGGELPKPIVVEAMTPEKIHARIGQFDFGVPVLPGVWYPHVDNP